MRVCVGPVELSRSVCAMSPILPRQPGRSACARPAETELGMKPRFEVPTGGPGIVAMIGDNFTPPSLAVHTEIAKERKMASAEVFPQACDLAKSNGLTLIAHSDRHYEIQDGVKS